MGISVKYRLSSVAQERLETMKKQGKLWPQIAEEVGMSSELLTRVRRGQRSVTLETAEALSGALGLELSQVYEKNISKTVHMY